MNLGQEVDPTDFENSDADKSLLVRFYTKPVQDKAKSNEEGRPIFKDKEYIEIRFAGNRSDAVARPAREGDKHRFPRHYEAFKKRQEIPEEGTPLAEWPAISRTQAEELAFYHVKTVEQLAAMNAANAQHFMGINALQQKAKEFLAMSKKVAEATKLQDELKQRDEVIAGLQKQMDALIAAQTEMKDEAKEPPAEIEIADLEAQAEDTTPSTKSRRRRKTE